MSDRIASWGLMLIAVVAVVDLEKLSKLLDPIFLGWLRVLQRVGPRIEVSVIGIATGLVCAIGTVMMLHLFGSWIYQEVRLKHARLDWPSAWRWSWTLSLLAAVVLMFLAGLVGVGLFRTTEWFLQTPTFLESGLKR